jgi:hypothetical protein
MPIPNRSTFESVYAGQASWGIGRPQKAIHKTEMITGSFLDAECGTNDNVLNFVTCRNFCATAKPNRSRPGQNRVEPGHSGRGGQVNPAHLIIEESKADPRWSAAFEGIGLHQESVMPLLNAA